MALSTRENSVDKLLNSNMVNASDRAQHEERSLRVVKNASSKPKSVKSVQLLHPGLGL